MLFRTQRRRSAFSAAILRFALGKLDRLGPLPVKVAQLLSTRADLLRLEDLKSLAVYRSQASHLNRHYWKEPVDGLILGRGCIATVFALAEGGVAIKRFRARDVALLRAQTRQCSRLIRLLSSYSRLQPLQRRLADEILEQISRQASAEDEARYHRAFATNFADQSFVRVPRYVRHAHDYILMERICGPRRLELLTPADRAHIGRILVRSLYQMIFSDGLIHGDLHPGNFLIVGHRVVLLDFGLCWELNRDDQLKFADFFIAFIRRDGHTCGQIALDMALHVPATLDEGKFRAAVQAMFVSLTDDRVSDFNVALFAYAMFRIQQNFGVISTLSFIAPIMALVSLEGTLRDLCPDLDFKREARSFVIHCLAGVQKRRASDNIVYRPLGCQEAG